MTIARIIAAILAPSLCLWAGCLGDLVVNVPADAGADVTLGCGHANVPLPPSTPDEPGNDVSFVTAIRTIHFESSMGKEPLGLDLDRFCTCQGEPPSCIAPKDQVEEFECDGPEGRDNVAPQWANFFSLVLNLKTAEDLAVLYSEFAELGRWSVLIRVSGYNGMPDDSKVRVDWLPSPGIAAPPTWNGNDTWPVSIDAAQPNGDPLYYDEAAYVANNKLIVALPISPLRMTNGLSQLYLRISDGTAMATIGKDATNRYELTDGVLAGRISMPDLFGMAAEFRDHNGQPFCTNGNPYYGAFRNALCRMPDIQVGSPSPNKRCDAASFAIGFDADPVAMVGALEPPNSTGMNCPPGEDPLTEFLDAGCPQAP